MILTDGACDDGDGGVTAKIFISYRRSDSKAITDRTFAWLSEQFGRDAVFYDIDTLPAGAVWRAHIRDEIGGARVVLAILSQRWLPEKIYGYRMTAGMI